MGCVVTIFCLSTLTPLAAHAQTLLPVVIKLPPTFLHMAPTSRVKAPVTFGVIKFLADAPQSNPHAPFRHEERAVEVRANELRGELPHQFDHHYFGLEAAKPGGAFALTLMVEPASVLKENAVNFVVLTDDGMKKVAAGVDPVAVKTAIGSPFLFDQVGNRLTALVPGTLQSKYTVVVFNNSKTATTYTLQVDGGVLVDAAGQSFAVAKTAELGAGALTVRLAADGQKSQLDKAAILAKYEGVIKRFGIATSEESIALFQQLLPDAVRARQMSGSLKNWQERHFLNLATDLGGSEVTITLRYAVAGGAPTHLDFWVMTQDGERHLEQGGLAEELSLASGLPVAGEPGVYRARLRMAQNLLYTVVVYSEGMTPADYTLSVQGGILMDRYGQTHEAQAQQEVLALTSN
jgi:hypothetical protein